MDFETFKLMFLSKVDPYKFSKYDGSSDIPRCKNPNFKNNDGSQRRLQESSNLPSVLIEKYQN
jgi:hypothetical protein